MNIHPQVQKYDMNSAPGHTPLLTVLSFGGGQDSTLILYRLLKDSNYRGCYAPGDLIVVMADTGNEHLHTYKHIEQCRNLCKEHNIPFFLLGDEWRSDSWKGGLKGHYRRYNVIMSKAMRTKSCTDQLKIQPIYRFLSYYVNVTYLNGMFREQNKQSLKVFVERYGKISMLLGISAEEASRRIESKKHCKNRGYMVTCVRKVYPLVEEGLTRGDCQNEIRKLELPLPFPSNCIWCPFMQKKELVWIHRNLPDELEELKDREAAKLTKFSFKEKNYGVFGKKTIDEILEEAIRQYGHLTDEELNLFKLSHGHCVTSKY